MPIQIDFNTLKMHYNLYATIYFIVQRICVVKVLFSRPLRMHLSTDIQLFNS